MITKTVTYDHPISESVEVVDGVETPKITYEHLSVTVSQANGIMGMRRHRLRYEQSLIVDTDPDSRRVRLGDYPEMVACADIQPDFDAFAAMPDAFLSKWEAAVKELNPHWYARATEKKVTI
jgi:hypothetical protein